MAKKAKTLVLLAIMACLPSAAWAYGGGIGCTDLPEYDRAMGALGGMPGACDVTVEQARRIVAEHGGGAAVIQPTRLDPRRAGIADIALLDRPTTDPSTKADFRWPLCGNQTKCRNDRSCTKLNVRSPCTTTALLAKKGERVIFCRCGSPTGKGLKSGDGIGYDEEVL